MSTASVRACVVLLPLAATALIAAATASGGPAKASPPLKAAVYKGSATYTTAAQLDAGNPGELAGGTDWLAQVSAQGSVVLRLARHSGFCPGNAGGLCWTASISITLTGGLTNFVQDGGDGSCALLAPNAVGGAGTFTDAGLPVDTTSNRLHPWNADFAVQGEFQGSVSATCTGVLGPNGVAGNTYTVPVQWGVADIPNFVVQAPIPGHVFNVTWTLYNRTSRLTLSFPK